MRANKDTIWIYHLETKERRRVKESDYLILMLDNWVKGVPYASPLTGRIRPSISRANRGRKLRIPPSSKERQRAGIIRYNKTRKLSPESKAKLGHPKGTVCCYDANGNFLRVSREEFQSRSDLYGVANKNRPHISS